MEKSSLNKSSLLKNIFNMDFIVSAIIPIAIFYAFSKFGMVFQGIMLSGIWSIGIVVVSFVKERKFNALAIIAAIFSGIGLIGTIISKNTTFYFISPIVRQSLSTLIFFGSLLFKKSLIQIIVEQSYLKNVPKEVLNDKRHVLVFSLLTVLWGSFSLIEAVLGIILLNTVSINSYYAISTLYDNIAGPVLLAFSITFPKWYLSVT